MYFKDQVIGRIQTWLLHGAAAPFLGKKTQIANLFYTNKSNFEKDLEKQDYKIPHLLVFRRKLPTFFHGL